jgi:hypothetical protein
MAEKFTIGRRGGGATEQRLSARVATTDGVRNDAGYGRGNKNPPLAVPPTVHKPDSLRGSNDAVPSTFSHKKDTTVTDTRKIEINFQPNVFDNYDIYTYHWKLFITSLGAASSGKVLTPSAQTIIAESGVSDLTIDNVELNGIAVPSVEAGTGTQTIIKFQITEPSGAGLLDKMYYESLALGIGNWLVMPCFLQLEFRGRDPVTKEVVENGAPGELGQLKWIWPVKLTNAKANVTLVGTKYDFDAIVYDELAQSSSYFAIQHNVVLSGLTNFGNAMNDLKKKLNADQYEKLLDNYSIPDTYEIIVDPDLAKIKIAVPSSNKNTSRAGDFIDLDKKVASYNQGTGIDKIVDSLLGSSPEFQDFLQSSDTPTSEPKSANDAAPMRKLWRIVTETKPIAFDMLRQDNAVEITIYVVPYDIGLIETTPSQTAQTSETLIAARKRLSTYASREILKKKYNYIFTGLNDQIVSFDLNMNFSFAATLARFGGVFYDTAISDKGVSQQENAKNEQEASDKVRKTLQFINDPANANNADVEIAAARSSILATNISPELKSRYAKILEKAKPTDRVNFVTEIKEAGGLDADGELNRTRINAQSLASNNKSDLNFISDIDIYSPAAQEAKKIAQSSRRGKLRPIPFREGVQETNLAFGLDPQSDAGRSRTASVFSTALYSTLDASLQQIKIVIKGDPFWLFPANIPGGTEVLNYKSNMDSGDAIELIKFGHKNNPGSVNLFGTDNFIVIRFRTPRIYNETTGITDPYSEVETFSGIYKVITIVSRFSSGKFTQELTCILDNLINLSDFPEFLRSIENANAVPDIELAPDQSAAETNRLLRSSLPDTTIRVDRIRGGE